MKVGDRVMTPDGPGQIISKDLPESRAWRWIVCIDEPRQLDLRNMPSQALCYFERELMEEDTDDGE
uniref:Uncharacterized protein n=1 Tax=viral metagenome TaxID=1070528 RepID=A0A6H1Z7N2_9ZZZZ